MVIFGLLGLYRMLFDRAFRISFTVALTKREQFKALMIAIAVFVFISIFILISHGAKHSEFEHLIPFILFPFALKTLHDYKFSQKLFFVSLGFSGVTAGIFALIQIAFFDLPHELRASGWMSNPIHFGNISAMITAACIAGTFALRKTQDPQLWEVSIVFLGVLFGTLALILSGSKSSLIALLAFIGYFFIRLIRSRLIPNREVMTLLACFFCVLVVSFLASPNNERFKTFQESISSVASQIAKGKEALPISSLETDRSFNDRLSQYRLSLDLIKESPVIGLSRTAIFDAQKVRVERGEPGFLKAYRHIHNEYLDMLLNKGVIGLGCLLSVFVFFWSSITKGTNEGISELSLLATGILVMIATMGLFDIVVYRVSIIAPTMLLLAYCISAVEVAGAEINISTSSNV